MKIFFSFILLFILFSCSSEKEPEIISLNNRAELLGPSNDSLPEVITSSVTTEENIPFVDATLLEEPETDTVSNAVYYITIADTGLNYFDLHKTMRLIAGETGIKIDTMGKGYNKKKKLIAYPMNHEDELYRGEYYPRRYPSACLSLEYMNFYNHNIEQKTIVLVAAICEQKDSAIYFAKQILPNHKKVFVLKSNVFIGCMH